MIIGIKYELNRIIILLITIISLLGFLIFILISYKYWEINKSPEPEFYCGVEDLTKNIDKNFSKSEQNGKLLFNNNCVICHMTTSEIVVGPGLENIEKRRDKKWLYNWIKNPQKLLKEGDEYANSLFEKFNRTQMTAFPKFTNKEIDDILAYIKGAN